MRIRGENRKEVYNIFRDVFEEIVGIGFKWRKGEKGEVIRMFNRVAEAMNIRDEECFVQVLRVFKSYLESSTSDWAKWSKKCRENYLGFINKKDNIELFVAEATNKINAKVKTNANNVTKTKTEEEWAW